MVLEHPSLFNTPEPRQRRVFYRPTISLRDSRIVGVEPLLRWQHPEHGLHEPSEIMAVAERSGLIVPIGEWVIDEACRQASACNREDQLLALA